MLSKLKSLVKRFFLFITFRDVRRAARNKKNIARLKSKDITIISSNCAGGVISHDLGLRFNSQFVNLAMRPKHFVKYLSNFDYYNSLDVSFPAELQSECWSGGHYPVGVVGDTEIHFIHYSSYEEASKKWSERKARINKDSLFIIMSERDGCTKEDLLAFDALPFKNKVVFTKLPYEDIKSSFYIPGFEKDSYVGVVLSFKNILSSKRIVDIFPYVDWFNGDYSVEDSK